MIKTKLAVVIEAFGVKGQNRATGAEVLTGLRAIEKMNLTDYKVKYNLMMLHRELEPRVSAWQESRQARIDGAMKPVLGDDGKVQKVRNEAGALVDYLDVPRDEMLALQATLKKELEEVVEIDRLMIEWPVMIDPSDADKQRRILPTPEDMALTADFIDYSKACA